MILVFVETAAEGVGCLNAGLSIVALERRNEDPRRIGVRRTATLYRASRLRTGHNGPDHQHEREKPRGQRRMASS